MDSRASVSSQPTDFAEITVESAGKISAYYSLVFPNITYYLQTLSVTIGRRCIPSTSSSSDLGQVDVDLGPVKSVSRLHAKIEYEEEEERFVLVVIGRNGAWVDNVWSGSGSRVSLSERSLIQIASRKFHFVLPPSPVPEDSPSPSSQSSANRPRSPSVDITSISPPSSMPSHSPPPTSLPRAVPDTPPLAEPQLPTARAIHKSNPASASKKRKKSNPAPLPVPKPEDMPPRPLLTYAQLCYRAIKAIGGKATLQEINQWIIASYDWYKYNDAGWQSSIRHNLSSNPAFKKMERCADAKRKGFFWSVDEKFEHTFQEQESRSHWSKSHDNEGGREGRPTRKKEKGGASILDPPLKRSVKSDMKALPPPLTSTPLAMKTSAPISHSLTQVPPVKSAPQTHAYSHTPSSSTAIAGPSNGPPTTTIPPLPPSLFIPIVVGPIPASHPSSSLSNGSNPLASTAIVLHDSTLILNPDVFSHLTPEQVKELEALGAQKALEILQGYIARFLKEQRLKKRDGGRVRGRGRGSKAGRGSTRADGSLSTGGDTAAQVKSGPFTMTPLPPRDTRPQPNGEMTNKLAPIDARGNDTEPTCVETKPPVPVPVVGTAVDTTEPIIVVDDSDSSEAPAAKRRKLDSLVSPVS